MITVIKCETSPGFLTITFVWAPVKCETKSKRNETKRNRTKRNETNRNETKSNETKPKIETKRNGI